MNRGRRAELGVAEEEEGVFVEAARSDRCLGSAVARFEAVRAAESVMTAKTRPSVSRCVGLASRVVHVPLLSISHRRVQSASLLAFLVHRRSTDLLDVIIHRVSCLRADLMRHLCDRDRLECSFQPVLYPAIQLEPLILSLVLVAAYMTAVYSCLLPYRVHMLRIAVRLCVGAVVPNKCADVEGGV